MTRLRLLLALASATLLSLVIPTSSLADSQVRMVRLSQVDGTVQIDRNLGNGFEKALPNMPITQGVRLQTGSNGRAEIELEDGNTIRIASETNVQFPELVLRDSGDHASTVELTLGTAYFSVKHKKKDAIRVTFAHQTIDIDHDVRFRVNVDLSKATVAVFKGELKVPKATETATLKKDETLTFDLVDEKQVAVAKGVSTLPTDNWDAERSEFQKQYSGSVYASTPYGTAPDLAYYGSYSFIPGYGQMWQPFGITAGWNPYLNGAWAFYPNIGYSWVSMDPWGWTPYHYGGWSYINGYGWGWAPTGPRTWRPTPTIVRQPAGFQAPVAPVVARTSVAQPTVIVNQTRTATGVPAAGFKGAPGSMNGRVATTGAGATNVRTTSPSMGGYHSTAPASAPHMGSSMSHGTGASTAGAGRSASSGGHSSNPR